MPKVKELPIPKAVLSDVDLTLLNSKRQFSAENRQAIEKYLIESQHNSSLPKLALCTARQLAALSKTVLPLFVEFAPESLHVICGGAMIIDAKGKVVWQEAIDSATTKETCHSVEALGGSFAFGHGDAFYCDLQYLKQRQQGQEPITYLPYSAIKDEETWTTSLIIITLINEAVETYVQGLKESNKFQLRKFLSTYNQQEYYNLTLPGVSKASGLKKWAELHQLDAKQIMMIGDGDNDLEAMEVGIGVAVANAETEVKEVAKFVLKYSNNENAIAWLLQEILKRSSAT